MEENILRVMQLALAINQAKQDKIRCEVQIDKDGYINLKVIEKIEIHSIVQDFENRKPYQPLISCCFKEGVDDSFVTQLIRKLENICRKLGLNTAERYMKVELCW